MAPRDLGSSFNNPLLAASTLPHGVPPFDQIKAAHFMPAIKAGIAAAEKEIDAIKANPDAPTFENTIEALEFSGTALGRTVNIFSCVSSTSTDDALSNLEPQIEVLLAKHGNAIMMDADLFDRIKAVYDQRGTLKLDAERKMLLEETYKGFVESGALLNAADKKEMAQISERLSELGATFKNNAVKSTAEFEKIIDDEKDLDGVPARAKDGYKHAAEEAGHKGKWLIKLSPPPLDILDSCKNRALREDIWRAMNNVASQGPYDNHPVTMEIVKLRHRMAEIMGYPNYAAYKLDDTMAKTPKDVMDLLNKNLSIYKPAADAFIDRLKDVAQKEDGIADFKPWDYAFYCRKLKEDTFKLDLEDLRPHFDLEKVLDGLRIHTEKLFDIKMTEVKGKYPAYHPDVKTFEITDNKTGDMIGVFYGDYYARPGAKSAGAWMDTIRKRGLEKAGGNNDFSLVYNACNFAKPAPGQPALLSLDEVRTAFHEFGHALHALLAEGSYRSLTCTAVKHDFVEVPSQLLENWAKEKEVLDTFAHHHATGQPLSAALIKKINDMETFDAAYAGLRQTFFGLLDMKWHTTDPKTIKDIETLEDDLIAKTGPFPRLAAPMSTHFSHLFGGGYAAGYYGYKWAEALEADIFTAFKKNGLYDRKTADRLRETVFSKGGTVAAEKLFEDMMGRKPDYDALHRREGLLPPKDKKPATPPKKTPPKP